jgi:hypothetical protein
MEKNNDDVCENCGLCRQYGHSEMCCEQCYKRSYEPYLTYLHEIKSIKESTLYLFVDYEKAISSLNDIGEKLKNSLINFQNVCEHKYFEDEKYYTDQSCYEYGSYTQKCLLCEKHNEPHYY